MQINWKVWNIYSYRVSIRKYTHYSWHLSSYDGQKREISVYGRGRTRTGSWCVTSRSAPVVKNPQKLCPLSYTILSHRESSAESEPIKSKTSPGKSQKVIIASLPGGDNCGDLLKWISKHQVFDQTYLWKMCSNESFASSAWHSVQTARSSISDVRFGANSEPLVWFSGMRTFWKLTESNFHLSLFNYWRDFKNIHKMNIFRKFQKLQLDAKIWI